ncbi:MAG: cytochrome c oxidase subunit 3 [Actinomycetota bacterium]|nr:cytochrome c oxidase subunit 3 [Actinomycetota bacterium]
MADLATAPAAAAAHDDVHGAHETTTGISNTKLAMWLFLGSECLLFGALISTFLLYKRQLNVFPGFEDAEVNRLGADIFDIPFTSVSSFVLLMSSLTMVLALSALGRGDIYRSKIWILSTALLGSIFIGGQVYEFTAFYNEGLGFTTNIFSSAFYTLTGFHGAHVTIGIIMLMTAYVMVSSGRLKRENAETLEIIGLYWHFVDIVWVFIFTVVYLIP